eukprot:gene70-70_t
MDGGMTEVGNFIEKLNTDLYEVTEGESCAREDISKLSTERFIRKYLLQQRPVVLTGIDIPLEPNNLLEVLKSNKDELVGIKIGLSQAFEGIDNLSNWPNHEDPIPERVYHQLESPDRVVVRAAHVDMKIGEFLELLTLHCSGGPGRADSNERRFSDPFHFSRESNITAAAYLEYFDLSTTPERLKRRLVDPLEQVLSTIGFPLLGAKPYLWMGDGNTIGVLHFDPYDNVLFQLEGSKTFHLMDPQHNERMYEGHIREAQVGVSKGWRQGGVGMSCPRPFRSHLVESTSMVHSPLRLQHWREDVQKYPLAADLSPPLACTVQAGEALYVPSFWWHEVVSSPGDHNVPYPNPESPGRTNLNVAVNYWFSKPLFEKEFPCSSCKKRFNAEEYIDLLDGYLTSMKEESKENKEDAEQCARIENG